MRTLLRLLPIFPLLFLCALADGGHYPHHGGYGDHDGPYGSGNFAYGYWNPYLGSSVRVMRDGYNEAYDIAFRAGGHGYH